MKNLPPFILSILVAGATCVMGQNVPALINYQGRLTDSSATPLPIGTYGVAFRLWDRQSLVAGQTLIWGREYDVTVIEGGAFNVILGAPGERTLADTPAPAVNELSFAFGESNRFLGLTITRDANGQIVSNPRELVPRQQILSVPYALFAQQAMQANQAETATALVKELADALCPPGTVMGWMGTNSVPPAGWQFCWGQQVSRTDAKYVRLFSVIGTSSGTGNGTTTFNLPDLRGLFLRGINGTRSDALADPDSASRTNAIAGGAFGNTVGSVQDSAFQSHFHGTAINTEGNGGVDAYGTGVRNPNTLNFPRSVMWGGSSGPTWAQNSDRSGGSETRPKNVYVQYLVKL
jgi:microcystin-dependent protein